MSIPPDNNNQSSAFPNVPTTSIQRFRHIQKDNIFKSNANNNSNNDLSTKLTRSKSLTKPERQRQRTNMINVHQNADKSRRHMSTNLQSQLAQHRHSTIIKVDKAETIEVKKKEPRVLNSWWAWISFFATCCFPPYIIRVWFGKTNKSMQQAWREKLTLCYLIAILCGLLAYVTYGLTIHLCPSDYKSYPYSTMINDDRVPLVRNSVYVFGKIYRFKTMQRFFQSQNLNLTTEFRGTEIGGIFDGDTNDYCAPYKQGSYDPTLLTCLITSRSGQTLQKQDGSCIPLITLHAYSRDNYLSFDWQDIHVEDPHLSVIVNTVVNMTGYLQQNNPIFGKDVDRVIRSTLGNDMTYFLHYTEAGKRARQCILARYSVGTTSQLKSSCIANKIILNVMLGTIIAIIAIRYFVACLFTWFVSHNLVKPGGRSGWLAWRSKKGGNDNPLNHIPGPYNNYGPMMLNSSVASIDRHQSSSASPQPLYTDTQPFQHENQGTTTNIVETKLYTVMLVTCYSEGEEGLRTTMDSLSNTTYSDKHKIFFVIADGIITGAGEKMSTPDIVINMMNISPNMSNPKPCSYIAVADGEKQLNMAKVYAGHYNNIPCITIVKCGTEEEKSNPKPGNRGKRDSQVILMSFFQRVLFNERLCELEYDIFWKMTWLMKGVTPDKFEVVLMVDADTQVLPDALTYMVAAMANDITIMGLCGETRIANKGASWVTAIQVFEYYISHHYAKAFEALFGIVTCLPGCFSMYRIKSPKNGAWVPILANPDIILEYNQNVVKTLHEKNLLLLGEDRFLSTLMLRTFPHRQMMFVPQARCRTVVPDTFSVLVSQRRRWINSTIHNLMELVLVSDLCGISFLSMQFSVFIDLIGTLVLPAAIVMSIYLIVAIAITSEPQWQSLCLLLAILFLPVILIAITTFKFVYIGWMIVYIIALPIWNFILPLYSFWHFDDFTWGATRVVVGEKKGDVHDSAEGEFDSSRLVMKKWEEWEAERTGQKINRKVQLRTPQGSMIYSTIQQNSSSTLFKL